MVEGCRALAQNHSLFFITITCKGREESWQHAEENYLKRTNVLLTACRSQAKRKNLKWHYVQVTERQKRKHPHSHFITTFCPIDAESVIVRKTVRQGGGQSEEQLSAHLWSNWFANSLRSAGLGEQYDITQVRQAEAASRYVAKYLFKPSIFTAEWPKGWKRIRYSQGFPKQEKPEGEAIVLLRREDWVDLSARAVVIECPDLDVYEVASLKMTGSDCIIKLRTA